MSLLKKQSEGHSTTELLVSLLAEGAALPAKSPFDTNGINQSNFDKYVFPNVFTIQFRILFSLYSIVF